MTFGWFQSDGTLPVSNDLVNNNVRIFFQYSACDGVRTSSFTRVNVFDEFINTIPTGVSKFFIIGGTS